MSFQSLNEFYKEVEKRQREGRVNIPDFGQYRCYFTRKTLKNDLGDLNDRERLTMLVMELFRNKKTNIAWPSLKNLLELTGMSKRTLIRVLRSLKEKGVFEVEKRKGNNNIYRFVRHA